jgi:hypothetical protein
VRIFGQIRIGMLIANAMRDFGQLPVWRLATV